MICDHGVDTINGTVCLKCLADQVGYRGDDKKHDKGKPMWDLLPWTSVKQIVDVMTFGANKYGSNTWQGINDGKNRYFAALMRHLIAWRRGERIDPESGIHHLAHAGCCLLFMMWLDDKGVN